GKKPYHFRRWSRALLVLHNLQQCRTVRKKARKVVQQLASTLTGMRHAFVMCESGPHKNPVRYHTEVNTHGYQATREIRFANNADWLRLVGGWGGRPGVRLGKPKRQRLDRGHSRSPRCRHQLDRHRGRLWAG